MHKYEALIHEFYKAFQARQYSVMQSLYHDDATFEDPAFGQLSCKEVKAMWEMLLTSAKDLKVEYTDVSVKGAEGRCHWEAWYTFTGTGKKVHNVIEAKFTFKDGKIFTHRDYFDLWRWLRYAFGFPGVVLGWTPYMQNKVRTTAKARLNKFMASK